MATPKKRGPKKKGGRPTAYKTGYNRIAEKMAMVGATDVEIAEALGVTVTTLTNWKAKYPKFLAALKGGKEKADAVVVESLYRRATGYKHNAVKIMQYEGAPVIVPYVERYPPDPTSMIFWLKNRRPQEWRDKQQHEHSADSGLAALLTAARGAQ